MAGPDDNSDDLLRLARAIVLHEQEAARHTAEAERLRAAFARRAVSAARGADAGIPVPVAGSVAEARLRPLARTTGLPARVQALIDMEARPLGVAEIAALLEGEVSIDTLRATLSKLVQRGTIARPSLGVYESLASRAEAPARASGGEKP